MSRILSFLLALLTATTAALGQTTFSARVVDAETGEVLPLVGVYVSESCNTLTNFDGEFSIAADSTDLLRITCVGRRSVTVRADQLPAEVRMQLLESTLSEVTVTAVEGTVVQIARKMEKKYESRRQKRAQYFYRQTSVLGANQDIVEAFVTARSAVNLRDLQFLTGRHGLLDKAAWERSNIQNMNLHHILEVGVLTRDATFWSRLITPLPTKYMGGGQIDYLQRFYRISIENVDGDDQHLYRITFRRREEEDVKEPIMTGVMYVDRVTLSPLAFDGQVENLRIVFGKGQLRSATTSLRLPTSRCRPSGATSRHAPCS